MTKKKALVTVGKLVIGVGFMLAGEAIGRGIMKEPMNDLTVAVAAQLKNLPKKGA